MHTVPPTSCPPSCSTTTRQALRTDIIWSRCKTSMLRPSCSCCRRAWKDVAGSKRQAGVESGEDAGEGVLQGGDAEGGDDFRHGSPSRAASSDAALMAFASELVSANEGPTSAICLRRRNRSARSLQSVLAEFASESARLDAGPAWRRKRSRMAVAGRVGSRS